MLNRLIAILYILMNKGTVTSKKLAERFEASTRIIYCEVERLSMAGIPYLWDDFILWRQYFML